tara:strand:+ start:471 stop:662 length:192 start_codon:yes stop_codon:yes gene_type:complete
MRGRGNLHQDSKVTLIELKLKTALFKTETAHSKILPGSSLCKQGIDKSQRKSPLGSSCSLTAE